MGGIKTILLIFCIFALILGTAAAVKEGLYRKGVIEDIIKIYINYETVFTQFFTSIVPVSGGALVFAHVGS